MHFIVTSNVVFSVLCFLFAFVYFTCCFLKALTIYKKGVVGEVRLVHYYLIICTVKKLMLQLLDIHISDIRLHTDVLFGCWILNQSLYRRLNYSYYGLMRCCKLWIYSLISQHPSRKLMTMIKVGCSAFGVSLLLTLLAGRWVETCACMFVEQITIA